MGESAPWPLREKENSAYDPYCRIETADGTYLPTTLHYDPWTEIWEFIPSGETAPKTVFQLFWLDPYSGIVFGSHIASRVNPAIFQQATLNIAKKINDCLGKTLSSTIFLAHASKKTRQNLERLFQTSEIAKTNRLAVEVIKCVLTSNTYIWRAAKIHKELVKAVLAQTNVGKDEGEDSNLFPTEEEVPRRKPKMSGTRMPKSRKSNSPSRRSRQKS